MSIDILLFPWEFDIRDEVTVEINFRDNSEEDLDGNIDDGFHKDTNSALLSFGIHLNIAFIPDIFPLVEIHAFCKLGHLTVRESYFLYKIIYLLLLMFIQLEDIEVELF